MPATEFSEQDFAPSAVDFTEEDFSQPPSPPLPPKYSPTPYEQAQMQGSMPPMGTMGPAHPEELLSVPDILKVPGALVEKSGIPETASRIAADFLTRTGIDPSAQAGVPMFNFKSLPVTRIPGTGISPLSLISPETARGVEEEAGSLVSGFTEPGQAAMLPFTPFKPVTALYGAQAISGVPESVQQIMQAQGLQQTAAAVTGLAANLGIGAAIGAHLLPRASRTALETITEKGIPDASRIQETAEVHGDLQPLAPKGAGEVPAQEGGAGVQPQAQRVATQTPLPLTDEEQQLLESERSAIDVPVDVVTEPLPPDVPFAGQIATIDRTSGRILINPREFSSWLKTVPQNQRQQAVRSLLSEERIHLGVDDAQADSYWNNLTALEKAIETRRYTGNWGGISTLTDTMLGHEAIRFRLQQLARMTPREIAEATGKEKWTVKAITALEDVVRGLRERFATKASLEQLEILDRIQEGLSAAKSVASGQSPAATRKDKTELFQQLARKPGQLEEELRREGYNVTPVGNAENLAQFWEVWYRGHKISEADTAEEGWKKVTDTELGSQQPAAMRKGRREEGPELFLPPVHPSEPLERHVFPQPNAVAIEAAAAKHFDDALSTGKAPSFEDFRNELQGQFGAMGKPGLWYAWQDAMANRLMKASGAELDGLVDAMELRGKLQAEHQQSFGKGTIPDPVDIPKAYQAQFEEMAKQFPHKKVITPRAVRQWFGPALRRRYAAIGQILDKLTEQAGPKPEKPWHRTEVGPEEITQILGERQFRPITAEEAANPTTVGDIVTKNAAVEATGKGAPPRTVTKNLVALRDKAGRIVLTSAWRDPRSGPRVTDPTSAKLPSRKIDSNLLRDWTPVSVMTLREPTQGFRKSFATEQEFYKWFGDIGIEGTTGIKSSMFAGPQAGTVEEQAGIRTGQAVPRVAEAGLPPVFTESDFVSPTATELTDVPRGTIPSGTPFYRSARPEPTPAERLPLAARQAVEARARGEYPYQPTTYEPSAALEARGIQIMPGARAVPGERIPPRSKQPQTPAALNKQKQAARDKLSLMSRALAASVARRTVKQDISRTLTAADNNAAITAITARTRIEMASLEELPTVTTKTGRTQVSTPKIVKEKLAEGKQRREAAIAYISSGHTDPRGVWHPDIDRIDIALPTKGARPAAPSFNDWLQRARTRAEMWQSDPNPLKRREGRKDMAYIDKLQKDLDYAKAHWNDPEFKAAAEQFRQEMAEQVRWEKANGFDVTEHANYIPQRYEGDFWNDNSVMFPGHRMLGTQFRDRKVFRNPYEAIAIGPYRMSSLDVANLAEHRINQGARQIEHDVWFKSLTRLIDPASQKPIAQNAVPTIKVDPVTDEKTIRYHAPSPDYTLVYARPNSRPMAVLSGFERIVRSVTAPSRLEELPGALLAIRANQMLKHGAILLWDSFHLGRMAQYAQALAGKKSLGYKGAYSALNYDPVTLADAVRKGYISPEAGRWATEPVTIRPGTTITRQQVLQQGINRGFNPVKITDALYKDAVREIPFLGEAYHRLVAPYNNWLFNKFIPGVMAESYVTNLERLAKENPRTPLSALFRDVAFDTNVFFGNLGKQGIFRSKLFQNLGQIFFLAPMWQEGLFQKEIRFAMRAGGAAARAVGIDLPYRQGMPAMGALGQGMARGLAAYFVATQLANLATRRQLTFQNPEKGHKFDAWIPVPFGKEGQGFWLSPLSVFGEVTHDIIRLSETKGRAWDVIRQMGANRLGPVGKMLYIMVTGQSPTGEEYSTTPNLLWGAGRQVVPFAGASPISLTVPARAVAHALAPQIFAPNQPGAVYRQALSAGAGIKTQAGETPTQQMQSIARRFIEDNGLQKDEEWKQTKTDAPGYTKLRAAIRVDDKAGARKILEHLRKTHTDDQIINAMSIWARRPFTGSNHHEDELKMSLSDDQLEVYTKANAERMQLLTDFYELLTSP